MVNAIDSKSISSDSQFKSEVGYWILYPNVLMVKCRSQKPCDVSSNLTFGIPIINRKAYEVGRDGECAGLQNQFSGVRILYLVFSLLFGEYN